jgi:phosphoribosylaminoimidazole-succinocarboxamide synthase
MNAIQETHFNFLNQTGFYRGKVRDVYFLDDKMLVIASDRISAFDVILPRPIPGKGQVLNQIAAYFLKATQDIVPNWLLETPDPNVSIGMRCEPFKVEMVVRGYLCGHAWRTYKSGERMLCGVRMPDGMKENDAFPAPIITPSTKADEGHDEDISKEEIIKRGLVSVQDWEVISDYALKLFKKGSEMALEQGLILADTKYEFGKKDGKIYLIDEIHTPDSSRYFYAEGYKERQTQNLPQKQLSKEFVREWLMENGFQGKEGQQMPVMTDKFVELVSERYIELFEKVTGQSFIKADTADIEARIRKNLAPYLS